jgi:transcriptional adapter 2-alpha
LRNGKTANEFPEHRPNHSYYIYDNLNFPLFTKDWIAKEELTLLQGVMKCGLGNWNDISSQYVETKSPKECEDHYFSFFYKSGR